MEKILPALEGQLRRFRRHAAWLAAAHPRLARQLGPPAAPDAHVDRLVQGVAMIHARTALSLERARWQQDEQLLELHFPEQLRPFPACGVGPARGAGDGVAIRGARYCPGHEAAIELDVEFRAAGAATAASIYIDGDATFSAAIRSALLGEGASCGASVRPRGAVDARMLANWPIAPTGLDPDEALLPRPPGAHAGLALLREYFTFPARFNVLRFDLQQLAGIGSWMLRLPAPGPDTPAARLLETLRPGHLRAGWRAQANLRRMAASPILLDGRQSEYLLSVPPEWEIFSIDRVRIDGAECREWTARCVDGAPSGHEWRIAFHADAARRIGAVGSIEVNCCRRSAVLGRAARGPGCRWRLNSLLALEQAPRDACALRELMATQAIANSPAALAIIGAVRSLAACPALLHPGRAAPLLGTEIRLAVDDAAFARSSVQLFAQVMDRFFGECAHIDAFTRLVLISAGTGEELIRCKARNGAIVLE
jgi:type VI secretion system protein ImpG